MMDALTLVRQMDPNDPRAVRFMVRRDQFEKLRDAVERQQVRILRLESVMRDMKKISQSGSICAADVMEAEIDAVMVETPEQSRESVQGELVGILNLIVDRKWSIASPIHARPDNEGAATHLMCSIEKPVIDEARTILARYKREGSEE